jgi:hypothetical protein
MGAVVQRRWSCRGGGAAEELEGGRLKRRQGEVVVSRLHETKRERARAARAKTTDCTQPRHPTPTPATPAIRQRERERSITNERYQDRRERKRTHTMTDYAPIFADSERSPDADVYPFAIPDLWRSSYLAPDLSRESQLFPIALLQGK